MMQVCAHAAPGQAWAANDKEKVMFRRRRPLLRAAAVGGGAYLAGKHVANKQADNAQMEAGQDDRISQLEQRVGPPPQAPIPPRPQPRQPLSSRG